MDEQQDMDEEIGFVTHDRLPGPEKKGTAIPKKTGSQTDL
jgi:hypothetical protein